eukprot:g6198.t1
MKRVERKSINVPTIEAWRISLIVIAIIINAFVGMVKSTIQFWYLRTLVRCDPSPAHKPPNLGGPQAGDEGWSGSAHCFDHDYVSIEAQFLYTGISSLRTLISVVCVPLLGSLSDRVGRRPVLVFAGVGPFIDLAMCAFAASASSESSAALFVFVGAVAAGSTAIFSATIVTSIVDYQIQKGKLAISAATTDTESVASIDDADAEEVVESTAEDGIGKVVGYSKGVAACGSAVGAMLGLYILTLYLTDYSTTCFALTIPCLLVIVLSCFAPETLPPEIPAEEEISPLRRRESLMIRKEVGEDIPKFCSWKGCKYRCRKRDSGPLAEWTLVFGSRSMLLLAAFVFFFFLGASSLSIVQSFMTTQFGWTSTRVTLALMSSGFVGFFFLVFAGSIIPLLGALKSTVVAAYLATSGTALMSFAPISSVLFMLGLYLICASVFGAVAYIQFVGARVDPTRMGALQGCLAAFALTAYVVGSNIAAALNESLGKRHRYTIFLIGAAVSALGCVIITYMHVQGFEEGLHKLSQLEMADKQEEKRAGERDKINSLLNKVTKRKQEEARLKNEERIAKTPKNEDFLSKKEADDIATELSKKAIPALGGRILEILDGAYTSKPIDL